MENKEFARMKPGEPLIGHVTDCVKLNVREAPNGDADVSGTLPVNTEVMIDESESTEIFYKICSASGFEGFCMKQFILIEQ